MNKDPLPAERIELIKSEIKKDLEQSLDAFALPLKNDSKDTSSDIDLATADLGPKDESPGVAEEGGVRKSGGSIAESNKRTEELF